MPTDTQPVLHSSRALVRPAKPADWEDPRLLESYFDSAAPGLGRELEASSLRSLLTRALLPPVMLGLIAQDADGAMAGLLLEDKVWDGQMLSARIRNLTLLVNAARTESRKNIAAQLVTHFLERHAELQGDCIFARVAADDTASVGALEDNGFHVLVPMVTLGKRADSAPAANYPSGIDIGEARPDEIEQMCAISRTAFRWGRFTADIQISRDSAERLLGAWARNCCLGLQASRVLVARNGHGVQGFIALKYQMVNTLQIGSIELIAVAENSRGKGLGSFLVHEGCEWLSKSARHVIVRTELPNTAALGMYQAQGFRVLSGSLYLSRWHHPSS